MEFIFFIFIYFFIYFFIIGFLTVLERRVLGVLGSRRGVIRVSFLNIYHFFLDFLKVVFKGLFLKWSFIIHLFLFLFVYLFFLLVLSLLLPINFLLNGFYYLFIFYIYLDLFLVVFKISLFNFFNFKYTKFSLFRMKKLYVIGESLFLTFCFVLLIFKDLNISTSLIDVSGILIFIAIIIFFFYIIFFKLFKTPFDYLEIESEFVGGLTLEFFGIFFSIWLLIEYISVFNTSLFMLYLVYLFEFWDFNIFSLNLFVIITGFIFLSKGVFLRVRFSVLLLCISKVFLIMFIFFFIYICLFISLD